MCTHIALSLFGDFLKSFNLSKTDPQSQVHFSIDALWSLKSKMFHFFVGLENILNNDLSDSRLTYFIPLFLSHSSWLSLCLWLTLLPPILNNLTRGGNAPVQTLSNKHSCAQTTSISDSALGIGSRQMWKHTHLWQYTISFPYWPVATLWLHLIEKRCKKVLPSQSFSPGLCIGSTAVSSFFSFFLFSNFCQGKMCFLLSDEEEDLWHLSVSGLGQPDIQSNKSSPLSSVLHPTHNDPR